MKRYFFFLLIVTLSLISLSLLAQGNPPIDEQLWDLSFNSQTGQFTFFDAPTGASTTGKPLDIGDFDGNGCGDIAVTGQNASHPIDGEWRGSGGHVRIIMNRCVIAGEIDMNTVDATSNNFFTIYGAYAGDMAGTETYVADFNGDGYDDLLFSAQNSDGPNQSRSNAGAAYVLFGSSSFHTHEDIDLRRPQRDVRIFYGATAEDRLGLWVEGGDFDGDGFHDALIGANQADGIDDYRANAGEAWIIYGGADMLTRYPPVTDMANPPEDATRIIGADYDDLLGSCVWGDDFNGDGFDDAVVSAGLWRASSGLGGLSFGGSDGPANRRYNSGESFVVFGHEDIRGQVIDLAGLINPDGSPIDEQITVVYGAEANDLLGEEIAAGDMDGDGQLDLILGTLIGDGAENDLDEAGEAWIIYTDDDFAGQMIDLADPPSGQTVVIYPDQADSKAGDTLRAGDVDNDGIDDLFYGAPDYDPVDYFGNSRINAGMMAIIFGESGGIPNHDGRIMLFDPPDGLRVRLLIGPEANDMMPYALAIYDVDNDGIIDIAPNAMGGDGADNAFINAGEIFVVSGAEFQNTAHVFKQDQPLESPTPWPTSTAVPQATVSAAGSGDSNAGQQLYEQTCFGCHGLNGEGIIGLGLSLIDSPLVKYSSEDELLSFLQEGRPAGHPENTTGVSMPPAGGRPDWGETELLNIIAYLRWMRDHSE